MIEVNDINDVRVSVFRSLKLQKQEHSTAGLFVAEGVKTCLQLLKSNLCVKSVFALREYFLELGNLIERHNIPDDLKFTAPKEIMNQIVGFRIHSGIMILADIPRQIELQELGNRIVVINGIIDSENVGSIIRNCAAFGFDSVIADESASSPYLRRAVRVSMGTVFYTKVHYSQNIVNTLNDLKIAGYTIIGAEITDASVPIDEFEFPEIFAVVFGTESKGISTGVIALCDSLVYIPVNPIVSSINVAASSSIILREASKTAKSINFQ